MSEREAQTEDCLLSRRNDEMMTDCETVVAMKLAAKEMTTIVLRFLSCQISSICDA